MAPITVEDAPAHPVQDAGRNLGGRGAEDRLTVSGIRRRVAEQSGLFTLDDIVPVPCNPDTLAMGYALRLDGQVHPLTRWLGPEALLAGPANTIVFERDPDLKAQVFKLFSTNHSPESQASCLSELMCCLPQIAAPENFDYRNVFRVLIVQFMDARSLDIRALKKSCIHMALPDGRLIPFESHNLFYRDDQAHRLEQLRAELDAFHAPRRATIPIAAATAIGVAAGWGTVTLGSPDWITGLSLGAAFATSVRDELLFRSLPFYFGRKAKVGGAALVVFATAISIPLAFAPWAALSAAVAAAVPPPRPAGIAGTGRCAGANAGRGRSRGSSGAAGARKNLRSRPPRLPAASRSRAKSRTHPDRAPCRAWESAAL